MEASRLYLVENQPEPPEEPEEPSSQLELPADPPQDVLAESGDPLETTTHFGDTPKPMSEIEGGDPVAGAIEEPPDDGDAELNATLDGLDDPQRELFNSFQANIASLDEGIDSGKLTRGQRIDLIHEISEQVRTAGYDSEAFWKQWCAERGIEVPGAQAEEPEPVPAPEVDPIRSAIRAEVGPLLTFVEEQRQAQALEAHARMRVDGFVTAYSQIMTQDHWGKPTFIDYDTVYDTLRSMDIDTNDSIAPAAAVRMAVDRIRASQPHPAQTAPAVNRRDPRSTIVIPAGSSSREVPFRDTDPLSGGAL